MDYARQIYNSLGIFLAQSANFIVKLLIAYIIWLIGKFLIDQAINLLEKVQIKKWEIDDKIRNTVINVAKPAAKFVLILVVLEYLGIGTTIVSAIAQGFTFSLAIALGLSFGEALKPHAKQIVESLKKEAVAKKD